MSFNEAQPVSARPDEQESKLFQNLRYGPGKENIKTVSSVTAATGGNMMFSAKADIMAKRLEKEAQSVAERISSRFSSWKPTTESVRDFIDVTNWPLDSNGFLDETPELEYIRLTKSAKYSIKVVALNVDMDGLIRNTKRDILNWLDGEESEPDEDAYGEIYSRCLKTDKNGTNWYYNQDTESWEMASCGNASVVTSSELAVLQYADRYYPNGLDDAYADELEQISSCYDCSTAQELEEVIASNQTILELRNRTQPYTKLRAIQASEEDTVLAVLPDDPNRIGFAMYADQTEYVLCQYITTNIINSEDTSEIPDEIIQEALQMPDDNYVKAYCREVGRIKDLDLAIRKVTDLAERYIRNFTYTVPLSLAATVEVKCASDLLDAANEHRGNASGEPLSDSEKENLKQAADNFLCVLATRRRHDIAEK